MALVSLTTTDAQALNISSDTILMVIEQTTERKLLWDRGGRDAEVHLITDTLADLLAAVAAPADGAGNLVQVTIGTDSVLLNANKIVAIAAEGTGSKVFYSDKGFGLSEYIVSEDPSALETAIDAL